MSAGTDESQDRRLAALEAENGELKLYLAAVIRLLKTKGQISEQELRAIVDAVDASDGSADGQFHGEVDSPR